jgi:hypothetical protein
MIVAILSYFICLSSAVSIDAHSHPTETLLVDPRIPVFVDGHWHIMSAMEQQQQQQQLQRRTAAPQQKGAEGVTTTIGIDVESATAAPASTTTNLLRPSSTAASSSPLPSPFDGALAANYSGNCPAFINAMLADQRFKSCYPFSVLLQGSSSFFDAQKSFVSITRVLDASCRADLEVCTDYLSDLANDMITPQNCGDDYSSENSVVVQAYMAFQAYNTIYRATCLQDQETMSYCFANAVTNLSSTSNVYLYYLPLNSTLPPTARPNCDWCTSSTMGIYQAATADRDSAISYTFEGAAAQVNGNCGSSFVNQTLAIAATEGSATSLLSTPTPLLLLSILIPSILHWLS